VKHEHTPGPWEACYSDEFGGGNIRSDHHRDGEGALLLIAGPMFNDYTPDRDEELANLRLASAAPDLLAALKALLESIESVDFSVLDDAGLHYRIPWSQAEVAIARATGEEGS
jgi:hypothetical protein